MLSKSLEQKYLERMENALRAATPVVSEFVPSTIHGKAKGGHNVATEIDRKISDVLRRVLPEPGEGWLSEEDADDRARLYSKVVWVVDPVDGTREYMEGIPEWCISIGLVIEGIAVAGGVCNPLTGELFLGSLNSGVTYNGLPVQVGSRTSLDGAVILASRQEYIRGEWERFEGKQFSVKPTGSIAYKLALVSSGLADATWTLSPKHEWDIAAGVALIDSSGGRVRCLHDTKLQFNKSETLRPGLLASNQGIWEHINQILDQIEPLPRS